MADSRTILTKADDGVASVQAHGRDLMKVVDGVARCTICNYKFGPNVVPGSALGSLVRRIFEHHQIEHRKEKR